MGWICQLTRSLPSHRTPLFVALSRLVPHKRVDLLLDAWREVYPITGGRFVVIGDGPEFGPLERWPPEFPASTCWLDQ